LDDFQVWGTTGKFRALGQSVPYFFWIKKI